MKTNIPRPKEENKFPIYKQKAVNNMYLSTEDFEIFPD